MLSDSGSGLLGGADFLAWIVLALGGAMAVGSVMALIRPPEKAKEEIGRAHV